LTYVGSAESTEHDQVLGTVYVPVLNAGIYKFVFESQPPNINDIPKRDPLGVTILLLSCHYKSKEFVRVGYYVNNEYETKELNEAHPPPPLQIEKVQRNVLVEKPRCTLFPISWDDEPADLPPVPAGSESRDQIPEEEREEQDGDYEGEDEESDGTRVEEEDYEEDLENPSNDNSEEEEENMQDV